jgi:prepilin signal peptidase PulO-like enzyme (type II secretory pathway)
VCCVQDLRAKEFSLWLALVLYAVAAANAILTSRLAANLAAAAVVFGILGAVSLLSKQHLGFGDVMILSALVLFKGFASGVFIFSTALIFCLVLCIIRLTFSKEKQNTETAFVPFLSIGFVMSFI